ncbi:MAG: DNA polymerase III subunit alpha [Bulleidia sp.]
MTVHLNIISSYTLMKSTIRMPALIQDLKNKGYDCCALTDHNVLYGAASFLHLCEKAGIHPIVGMETDVIYHEETVPFLLLSMDKRGYRNLIQLSSLINTRKERACTTQEFIHYSQGCFIIAYGEGGWMDSELVNEQYDRVLEKLNIMKQELPEFDMALSYMEASLWKNRNSRLKRLCHNCRIHTVAVNKICYLNREDAATLRVLTAVDRGITLNDASLPNIQGRYVLTPQQMAMLYEEDDLLRTDEIAKRCTCDYRLEPAGLPVFENGTGAGSEEYLRSLCYAGLKKRLNGNLKQEYVDRLKYELDVITKMGFSDYFLIVYDFIRYGRTHDIMIGPGRGSAAGSLAAYCLGITMVDPMEYNLLFERFLNPERVSLPDIDTDIPDNRRDEIIRYVTKRYGSDHVCNIITFGTFGARQAIRDVGKVMALPQREVDTISKLVPNKAKMTLDLAMKTERRFASLIHSRKTYETLFETARRIEGLPRHESIHAAGIIMSGKPLSQVVPTVRFSDEILTSQFTMEYLEERGLIKMDFLGLRNLSIIDEIVQEIRKEKPSFSIMHVSLQDQKTMQVFGSGDTTGVFQFESEGMKNLLRRMKPKDINDIACAMALYRPSASMHIDEYLNHRAHPETITYPCRELVPVLAETGGIMIYQEQVMQCATIVAGFTMAKADILRRAISKKNMDVMASMKQAFIQGCVNNGHTRELGERLFALIEQFAGYGFNKSHAVAYSYIACQLAWLKAHVPLIFYTALLNSCIGDHKKTGQYIDECRKRKITICYPDVNLSTDRYIHDAAGIILPLTAITSIGSQTASQIVEEREKNGPYQNYIDFVARASMYRITKVNLEALIDAGALDSFEYNRQTMKDALDDVLRYSELVRIDEGEQMRIDLSLISAPAIILRAQSQDEKNENERKVLGFTLGPSLTAQLRQENGIRVPVLSTITTMQGEVDGFAQIREVKEHRAKKGTLMAFVRIADETAELEMRVMPLQYNRYNSLLMRGRYILFHAKMTEEGYLIAENIRGIGKEKHYDKNTDRR